MRPYLLVLTLLFLSFNAASAAPAVKPAPSSTGASAFSRNPVLPKWAQPLEAVPVTKSEEPVVIRLAETQYWTGPNPAYLINRAVQVNASSRLSELGQFAIPFTPAYQKLVLHRIVILRGNEVLERTKSANIRVLDSETDAEKGSYYGQSTAQLLLEDVRPGDTLWLTYSVQGSNPVFGSTWSERTSWSKESPTELRKVTVLHPAGQPTVWRWSGAARASLPAPVVEQNDGVGKLVFREAALAADEYETSTPPDLIPMTVLDLSAYRNWNEVARWAVALFPATTGNAEMQALVRKFAADTPEQRASLALHWVQDEIRYFSVSMGENSHRPQPPEVVLKRRFGDCKDKSQLLVTLYRAMGLEAQPVLLHSLAPGLPAQLLPSPGSFNHAIVRVVLGGKAYFVDPTLQGERGLISALPVPVPSAAALIVRSDTTGLTSLPDENMEQPLIERSVRLTVASLRGDAGLNLRTEYRGRYAAGMRQYYRALGSIDVKKALLEQLERTYPGVQLDGPATLSDGASGASFIVDARFTVPKVLKEKDGSFALAQRAYVLEGTLGIPEKLVRKQPLWLAAGRYRARYNFDAALPGEARLVKQDEHAAVVTKNFDARAQLTWRGAQLNYYVDYVITNPEVAPADLPNLSEQVRKLDSMFESEFRFQPVEVAPQAAEVASLRVLDIMNKLSSYQALQLEAIRTGKSPELTLDESDYAKLNYRGLCESLLDTYSVRQWNPLLGTSVKPLHALVQARADQRTKDLCMARLNFIGHDLEQASKDLLKLAPADDDPLTLMQAWADFHARAPGRAGSDLARFLKAKQQGGTLDANDALLALALSRRLGIDEPAEVRQLVSTLRPDAWPMPLFSLLRGGLSADDLLAAIGQLPASGREYATMEAHFFISQAWLARREPRKADAHLNWLARFGILGSDYEVLADADRYSAERADPDMREAWRLQRQHGTQNAIALAQKAAAEKGVTLAQMAMARRYLAGDEVRADVPKGLALFDAAAAKGNHDALTELGGVYAEGLLAPQDNPRAVGYYRQAAENGNPYAAYNLGWAYWFGKLGLPIDFDQSFRYMKDAAELEIADAHFFLSRMYSEGKGTEKNDSLAMFWAFQAFSRGQTDGAAQLGLLILKLGPDDASQVYGLQLLSGAAAKGNSFARLEYARLLLVGVGGKSDTRSAFQLVQLASNSGHERAKALMGRMYVQGLGVDANVAKGLEILAGLQQTDVPDAWYQLGLIYRDGAAGMMDKAKAADCFRHGAKLQQREAAEALAVMLHTGDGIAVDLPEAARYYAMASKSGYPRAMNNLASMYEKGEGGPQDSGKAIALYRRAAQMGHPVAMLNLAETYESGPLAKKALFVPLAYYMLANKFGLHDADEGMARVKRLADPATVEKAQTYISTWKPGNAMPDEA